MSGYIEIDTGIQFWASNIVMSLVQREIAERIPPSHQRLKIWLRDMSGRGSPFGDFYILGLELEDRIALLTAIETTKKDSEEEHDGPLMDQLVELTELIERAKREFPGYPDRPNAENMEDLDQIWGTGDVDADAAMDKLMNEVNEGAVRLYTLDEYLTRDDKESDVEPTDAPDA